MKPKVYIDGQEGTTGLQIQNRLAGRADINLLYIDESKRKDISERKKLISEADLVFLCLPDDAAREAVLLIDNDKTRIIDASTAHRVSDGWVYGLPELSNKQKKQIRESKRVSNPGCHSTGVILLLAPLKEADLIPPDYPVVITSVTGYTGGGRKMIEEYEKSDREDQCELNAPRLYSTGSSHKHIPEIIRYTGLENAPLLLPIVADYPQGMQIIIPLKLPNKRKEVLETLISHYADCKNIDVLDSSPQFAVSNSFTNRDSVTLRVLGFDDTIILTAQLNNLGKGAAGAAVQNMNIMLGFDEYDGLNLKR